MRVIHKAVISTTTPSEQLVRMPVDARIVHAEIQGEDESVLSVWFECDPELATYERRLQLFATGQVIPDDFRHLRTHVLLGGALVLHLCGSTR